MEEQSSTNRILLVVGFLTVLFLFKEYAASGMVPDLEVFGIVVKFETVWFVNTLVFAVTLFLFAAGSFLRGYLGYYVAEAGPVFYKISVLLIPLFFLIYVGAAFIRFQDEHWMAFRIGGTVIFIGGVIAGVIYIRHRR